MSDITTTTTTTTAPVSEESDVVTAVVLVFSTTIFISLFYFTNSENKELRAYIWNILEAAVSILTAIMISEAGKDFMYIIFDNEGHYVRLGYALFCTVVMQLASLAVHSWKANRGGRRNGVAVLKIRTRTFGGLAARGCAFSWITFWGGFWEYKSVVVPMVALLTWTLLMCAFAFVRGLYINMDGEVTDEEREWTEMLRATENNAAGLCLSFLLSQLVRYWVGGVHPNGGGVEVADMAITDVKTHAHQTYEMFILFASAIFCGVLGYVSSKYKGALVAKFDQWPRLHWLAERITTTISGTLYKTCGWLVLFTVVWVVESPSFMGAVYDAKARNLDMMVQTRAITGVICSYLSFLVIKLLIYAPSHEDGDFKKGTLLTLQLMVGFAWRRCFGLAIDKMTHFGGPRIFNKIHGDPMDKDISDEASLHAELALEILICVPMVVMLVPALYWYMVPSAMEAESGTGAEPKKSCLMRPSRSPALRTSARTPDQPPAVELTATTAEK